MVSAIPPVALVPQSIQRLQLMQSNSRIKVKPYPPQVFEPKTGQYYLIVMDATVTVPEIPAPNKPYQL